MLHWEVFYESTDHEESTLKDLQLYDLIDALLLFQLVEGSNEESCEDRRFRLLAIAREMKDAGLFRTINDDNTLPIPDLSLHNFVVRQFSSLGSASQLMWHAVEVVDRDVQSLCHLFSFIDHWFESGVKIMPMIATKTMRYNRLKWVEISLRSRAFLPKCCPIGCLVIWMMDGYIGSPWLRELYNLSVGTFHQGNLNARC